MKQIKVDLNIAPLMLPVQHGRHPKDMVVLHETVSPDYAGFTDLLSVARYMPRNGLGIHGIIDKEGFLAWSVFGETWILWHASSTDANSVSHGVNSRAIGIELVSNVMQKYPDRERRFEWWWARSAQLEKTARVLAYLHRTQKIPLVVSDGGEPGVTTHFQVTKRWKVPGGHTDAWPKHLGGYFPLQRVIFRARQLVKRGY